MTYHHTYINVLLGILGVLILINPMTPARIVRRYYFQTTIADSHAVHFVLFHAEENETTCEQLNRVTITEPLTSVMERHTPQNDDI